LANCEKEFPDEAKAYRFNFQFITENYKPFNYLEGTELKGLAADLLREICTSLSIPFKVDVLPWEQGYQLALTKSNAVLFSTVLNTNRKSLFKWAGPIASIDWVFYAASPSSISLTSLEDGKSAPRIGVLKDYASEQ